MDASSFKFALRRFSPAALLRSGRGTNFFSDKSERVATDEESIQKFVVPQGSLWSFNVTHASHFVGALTGRYAHFKKYK